jgi:hypothetical protein
MSGPGPLSFISHGGILAHAYLRCPGVPPVGRSHPGTCEGPAVFKATARISLGRCGSPLSWAPISPSRGHTSAITERPRSHGGGFTPGVAGDHPVKIWLYFDGGIVERRVPTTRFPPPFEADCPFSANCKNDTFPPEVFSRFALRVPFSVTTTRFSCTRQRRSATRRPTRARARDQRRPTRARRDKRRPTRGVRGTNGTAGRSDPYASV